MFKKLIEQNLFQKSFINLNTVYKYVNILILWIDQLKKTKNCKLNFIAWRF